MLAGFGQLGSRYRAEARLSDTEILLDATAFFDWQASLADEGSTLAARLQAARVDSLAFGELHLDELVEKGQATTLSYQELQLACRGGGLLSETVGPAQIADVMESNTVRWSSGRPGCYLLFADPTLARSVARTLSITVGEDVAGLLEDRLLFVPLTVRQLRLRSLGFDGAAIAAMAKQGFRLWLRPENAPGLTAEQLNRLVGLWVETLPPVEGVIFGGPLNEALGYPEELEATARLLEERRWKLGYIELPDRSQQAGIEFLVRALPGQTARVMAVSPAHQQKLSPYRVLGMYSLGARERNLRVLYIRPFDVPGRPELDEEFVFSLAEQVKPEGPAATFAAGVAAPPWALVLLHAVGGGALGGLLWLSLGGRLGPRGMAFWLGLPLLGFGLLGGLGKPVLFRQLLALCLSVAGPTLAFLLWVYPALEETKPRASLGTGLRLLALCSGASFLTGLWVAALLPDTTFLLGLDRFRGVKLLTLGTPLLIVVCFLVKRYSLPQWWAGMTASVKVYQAAAVAVLLAVLGLLLLRTGNEAGAAASEGERYLRVFLDQMLGVRPRFKEFLLAHPALLCAPLGASLGGFGASLPLVLLAAVGQAGIVDTFAHLHTPLTVTLIRVWLGVFLGGLFGMAAHRLLRGIWERLAKSVLAWREHGK